MQKTFSLTKELEMLTASSLAKILPATKLLTCLDPSWLLNNWWIPALSPLPYFRLKKEKILAFLTGRLSCKELLVLLFNSIVF